ncbi:MAG: hypothetical protein RRY16_02550 [Bacilli bacterium]
MNEVTTTLENSLKEQKSSLLDVRKTLNIYNTKDIDNLIKYTKDLENLNHFQKHSIDEKERINKKSEEENTNYKYDIELIEAKRDNNFKDKQIKYYEYEYNYLESAFNTIAKALTTTLKIAPRKSIGEYMKLAKDINNKEKEAQNQFSKLFKNDDEMQL